MKLAHTIISCFQVMFVTFFGCNLAYGQSNDNSLSISVSDTSNLQREVVDSVYNDIFSELTEGVAHEHATRRKESVQTMIDTYQESILEDIYLRMEEEE